MPRLMPQTLGLNRSNNEAIRGVRGVAKEIGTGAATLSGVKRGDLRDRSEADAGTRRHDQVAAKFTAALCASRRGFARPG